MQRINSESDAVSSPDALTAGFLDQPVDPLRYDGQPNEPDEVVGVLSAMVPVGSRILDVGCGTGSVSIQLAANRNAKLIGLEPDTARAALARQRGMTVVAAALSAKTVAELGSFDVVLFADVLEHVANPFALLALAKTALRTEGRIVASVPNVAHWSLRSDLLRGRFVYRDTGITDATHLRWFTEDGIRRLFERSELVVDDIRPTAGHDLHCYRERLPWRRMSTPTRKALVRKAVRRWPRLFACQWVISGRLPT
jgi:methionine biosynthesis protein MetW